LGPKQTDLVPDKGQFHSRFPPFAPLLLSDNDFSGSAQPTPTSSQRNTSGRAGWAVGGAKNLPYSELTGKFVTP
jgi:hypothetical protein